MISMGLPHGAVPLTGAMCVAAAARVEGTIVHEASRRVEGDTLRVGHASGALPVAAKITRNVDGGYVAESASVFRTARRLMSGSVYAPVRS
jgi:2-methylaconitate cis-trans-isomerase PrpF